VQVAAWLAALVASLLLPPPIEARAYASDTTSHLARFLVAALLGLVLVPGRLFRSKRHAWSWWALGIGSLIVMLAIVLVYQGESRRWVCGTGDRYFLMGDELTPKARTYTAESGESDCGRLLADFGFESSALWTKQSIDRVRGRLEGLYLGAFAAAAVVPLLVLQAVHRSRSSR
jgi:hypothetical protein